MIEQHRAVLELHAHTTLADVLSFAAGQHWPASDPAHVDDLRLLLEELLSNIVRHAFVAHPAPWANCSLAPLLAGSIDILLKDNGPAFNPFDAANVPGYGLALVRALTDQHEYAYQEGENRLRVHLKLY